MQNSKPFSFAAALLLLATAPLLPAADAPKSAPVAKPNLSLQNEIQHAIDKGVAWLAANQNTNGWWSTPDQPAVSSMALVALQGDPSKKHRHAESPVLKQGYRFVLSHVKPDGGIYSTNMPTYNTAITMMALVAANDPSYEATLRKARTYLVGLQRDFDEKGKTDNVMDGGIGYGSKYEHSDMGNTLMALEALYYTKHLVKDSPGDSTKDLDWAAAISFIQNCQNLPSHNKQAWASDDAQNKGGFVYYPGKSMAGETNLANGRVALRSYGSISYGGMMSYLYAQLDRKDPRVQAVYTWLKDNYTLAENPGMGSSGMFFYYHTMTKALTVYGDNELVLKDGRKVNWRQELALRLLNLQNTDGSWLNENNRWWEKDPALVTSYSLIALEMISRGL